MRKFLILFVSVSIFFLLKAQTDIKLFIKQNTVPISTIEPDSNDYIDLEKLEMLL